MTVNHDPNPAARGFFNSLLDDPINAGALLDFRLPVICRSGACRATRVSGRSPIWNGGPSWSTTPPATGTCQTVARLDRQRPAPELDGAMCSSAGGTPKQSRRSSSARGPLVAGSGGKAAASSTVTHIDDLVGTPAPCRGGAERPSQSVDQGQGGSCLCPRESEPCFFFGQVVKGLAIWRFCCVISWRNVNRPGFLARPFCSCYEGIRRWRLEP